MKLTYVRWSMTIIETMGLTLVTDPVFRMFGAHQIPKSYTLDQMPRPDLVFISHTHLDHFERAVLRQLPQETPVWMPVSAARTANLRSALNDGSGLIRGASTRAKAAGAGLRVVRGVQEWESDWFRGIRLTAVPAQHSSDELGLVVEGDRTVYFAGNTSLDRELFGAIGDRWNLDAVLLPIGDLRVLGLSIGHIKPKTAPQALRLLGEPRVVVPTHYSGMTLGPLVSFGGTPRKLSHAIHEAELGTLVGTTRPLETVEV